MGIRFLLYHWADKSLLWLEEVNEKSREGGCFTLKLFPLESGGRSVFMESWRQGDGLPFARWSALFVFNTCLIDWSTIKMRSWWCKKHNYSLTHMDLVVKGKQCTAYCINYYKWEGRHMQHNCLRPWFLSNIHSALETASGTLFASQAICLPTEPLIQHQYDCATHKLRFSAASPSPVPQNMTNEGAACILSLHTGPLIQPRCTSHHPLNTLCFSDDHTSEDYVSSN